MASRVDIPPDGPFFSLIDFFHQTPSNFISVAAFLPSTSKADSQSAGLFFF